MKTYSFFMVAMLWLLCQAQAQQDKSYTFNFETAQSTLPENALADLIGQVESFPDYNIIIQGHTDNVGSDTYNLQLSEQRAKRVQKLLEKTGINTTKIQTKSFGASQPIASNRNAKGKQKNRRVEILLTTETNLNQDHQVAIQRKLNKLIDKKGQWHTVTAGNKPQRITAKQGTVIRIPANAFDVPEGTKIKVKVTEVFKKSDIILYNLSTTSDDRMLITGGMLKVDAFANGQAIELKAGKALNIDIPTDNPTDEMQLFISENIAGNALLTNQATLLQKEVNPANNQMASSFRSTASNDNINWVNPQALNINEYWDAPPTLNWNYPPPTYKNTNVEPLYPYDLYRPTTIDTNHLARLKKQHAERVANPMKGFKGYKTKKFLFWKYKVKATEADKERHLSNVENIKKRLIREIDAEKVRLDELHKKHNEYQQQLVLLNIHQEWEKHRDSIWTENLILAIEHKDYNSISRYSQTLTLSAQAELWSKIWGHEITLDNRHYPAWLPQSTIALSKAIESNDPKMVNLLIRPKDKQKFMCHYYKKETVEEAYIAHLKSRDKVVFEKKAQELGVTVEEAIRQTRIFQNWQKKSKYNFNISRLGRYINCDYFPRQFPREQLVCAETQLALPLAQTRTMMVFDNFGTVMNGYHSYLGANGCNWPNIPQGEPVKIISIYLDKEGQTHVALHPTRIEKKLPKLEYKPMSLDQLGQVLSVLDS